MTPGTFIYTRFPEEFQVDEDVVAVSEAYIAAESAEALLHFHQDGEPFSIVAGHVIGFRTA